MKVNVGIVTSDFSWLRRLEEKLVGSQLVIHSFETGSHALEKLRELNIKVLLLDQEHIDDEETFSDNNLNHHNIGKNVFDFKIDSKNFSNHKVALSYLVPDQQIEFVNGSPTISKYYRIDEFERQVLQLFQHVIGNMKLRRLSSGTKVVNVTSPSGGVGTTTTAVALSRALTNVGNRTLYIELGRFPGFHVAGASPNSFSDIIFAIKMKKSNLGLAIDSVIQQNEVTGVYFIAPSPNAYDMQEITDAEFAFFVETCFTLDYDYIILDSSIDNSAASQLALETADLNIVVSNGSATSKSKVSRFFDVAQRYDELKGTAISNSLAVVYNQFGSSDSMIEADLPVLGGINKFKGYSEQQVIEEITATKMPAIVRQLVDAQSDGDGVEENRG